MGIGAYIDQQLHPERLPDDALNARLATFQTVSLSSEELTEKYFLPAQMARRDQQLKQAKADAKAAEGRSVDERAWRTMPTRRRPGRCSRCRRKSWQARQGEQLVLNELMQAHVLRAAMSERQLDEVLVDFWINHFNVFIGKGQVRQYLPEYERDVIRPHVLGSFRDLLGAVAHSPAMLFYLDNWQSAAPNSGPALPPQVAAAPERPAAAARAARAAAGAAAADARPAEAQQPRAEAEARPERELRPRADGTAHARRRRRLHAEGRRRRRARADRLDDRSAAAGRRVRLPAADARHGREDDPRRALSRRATARTRASACSTCSPSIPARRTTSRTNWRSASSPTSRRPRWSIAPRRPSSSTKGDLREVVRVHRHVAGVLRAGRVSREGEVAARVRDLGRARVGRDHRQRDADRAGAARHARHAALRLPAADRVQQHGGRVGQHRRAAQPHELRRAAGQRRPDAAAGGGRRRRPPAGQAGQPGQPGTGPTGRETGACRSRRCGPASSRARRCRWTSRPRADTSEASQISCSTPCWRGDVSDATRQVLAQAETPQHLVALTLGSPEFQRR